MFNKSPILPQKASLANQEWYSNLVEECKAIITEAIFTSRYALVEGYWLLGQRIREEEDLKKWEQNKAGRVLQDLAKDTNISTRTIHYALQAYDKYPNIGSMPEGKNITWNKLITKYLPEPKTETIPLPEAPEGKYNVIYVDPPWDVKAGPDWGSGEESKDLLYSTMSIEEITALPVQNLSAKDCHLYLWTINKYIPETYAIAKAWGFEPSCLLTWAKPPHGIGLGGTFVQTTEHLLFCRKGTLQASKRIDTTWFECPRGRHSEKPDEFRKMIEEVSPGKRIELFAREKVRDWDVWGNEV
jgi:N6-adenosine-specific RNA methylase IME4